MLKLKKFKEKKLNNRNIMISFAILIGLLSFGYLSKSYAIYKMQKEFDVIKSKVGSFSSGDVKVAVLVDGKETSEFPSYETNYKIESVECTNGVNAYWSVENWELRISDMSATSTKCTVSFNSSATNEVTPINMSKKEILALNEEITNLATSTILDKVYPVGSIYMTTTEDTVEKVEDKFGGTWVRYATDTTLVGYKENTNKVNDTGGSKTVTLTTANLPSHSHVIPSLSVSSWSGSHNHTPNSGGNFFVMDSTTAEISYGFERGAAFDTANKVRTSSTSSTTITVSGQTTTASNTTTCTNCSANPINIQNPYTVVYMYKRTA